MFWVRAESAFSWVWRRVLIEEMGQRVFILGCRTRSYAGEWTVSAYTGIHGMECLFWDIGHGLLFFGYGIMSVYSRI